VLRGCYDLDAAAIRAVAELAGKRPVLICSPSEGEAMAAQVLALGRTLGLTDVQTGIRIADTLADLAWRLLSAGCVDRLVVSGGETSGAVCNRLGIRAVEVGLPLSPGVPYCFTWPDRELLLVLKSGNFGTEDLYQRVRNL
jgi:3-dehydrotetronate 4-kinase